jgi:hypothetical protein
MPQSNPYDQFSMDQPLSSGIPVPANPYDQFEEGWGDFEPVATDQDIDPTFADYGRMVLAGGAQIGSGVGWLAGKFGLPGAESLQAAGAEKARGLMENLSPQAQAALAVEFTSRDEGELWTDKKWRKAKLIAAQSLLGTAAGMGVGSILTRGLGAAGMTTAATTAAGATVQVPSRVAGAIGYGLGEAGVAAPSVGASVEEEIMAMSHDDLMENAADYRAIYASLENKNPNVRAERAKRLLAKAAAGDASALALVSTFILSAPLGAVVGGFTGKLPLATTRPRSIAVGAGGEATQEFLQSGAEKIAENIGMRAADPTRALTAGALEEAVGGAMAGGMMGAVPGAITPLEVQGVADEESPLGALGRAGEAEAEVAVLPEKDELDQQLDAALDELNLGRATEELQDQIIKDLQFLAEDKVATEEGIKAEEIESMEFDREAEAEREARRVELQKEIGFREIAEKRGEEELELGRAREEIEEGRLGGRVEPEASQVGMVGEHPLRQRIEERVIDEETGETAPVTITEPVGKVAGAPQTREQLHAMGAQPAEGEIVAGELVTTAGRPGTSLGEAMREAGVQKPKGPISGTPPAAPAAPVPTEPTPAGEPGVGYADERLKSEENQAHLQRMTGELERRSGGELVPDSEYVGGESDKRTDEGGYEAPLKRLPSRNPQWFKDLAASENVTVAYTQAAVEKALAGKRLGVKQKRVIQNMLDEIDFQREEQGTQEPTGPIGLPPDPTDVELRGTEPLYDEVLSRTNFDETASLEDAQVGDTILDHPFEDDPDPRQGHALVLDIHPKTGSKLIVGLQTRGPLVDPARGNKKVTHDAGLYFSSVPYQGYGTAYSKDYETLQEAIDEFRAAGDSQVLVLSSTKKNLMKWGRTPKNVYSNRQFPKIE